MRKKLEPSRSDAHGPLPDAARAAQDEKAAARAAALRENLRRRKAAARKAESAPRDGSEWTK
jgi:hypothetical protein